MARKLRRTVLFRFGLISRKQSINLFIENAKEPFKGPFRESFGGKKDPYILWPTNAGTLPGTFPGLQVRDCLIPLDLAQLYLNIVRNNKSRI